MNKWYLVKSNWPQTVEALTNTDVKIFAGLGGDIWPLGSVESQDAKIAQSKIEQSRSYTIINQSYEIFIVSCFTKAEQYYLLAKKKQLLPLFLELSIVSGGNGKGFDGYDFGDPEGGWSVIETEILTKRNTVFANKYLNREVGLFRSLDLMDEFLNDCEEEENFTNYCSVGVKILEQ